MQGTARLKQLITPFLPSSHKRRLLAVLFGVKAIFDGGSLGLSAMGRAVRCRPLPKHNIKRLDRLLSNPLLHEELPRFAGIIIGRLLGPLKRPLILVDWTQLGENFYGLVAALPLEGRSIPLWWEVHPKKKLGNPKVQRDFLHTLRTLLPPDVRPILVTDAGFQSPWFKEVEAMGWDYVGRLGSTILITQAGHKRGYQVRTFFKHALGTVSDLGRCNVFTRNRTLVARVVLGKQFVRNPLRPKRRRIVTYRSRGQNQAVRRNSEPWVLVSSLHEVSAKAIDQIYRQRMWIEELYRDLKNPRFGWSLAHFRSRSNKRWEVLLVSVRQTPFL